MLIQNRANGKRIEVSEHQWETLKKHKMDKLYKVISTSDQIVTNEVSQRKQTNKTNS